MFTIIGGDGQEYGPVSLQQLRSWVNEGRANLDTKAKAAGSDEWQRLGDLPEFSEGTATSVPPPLYSRSATTPVGPVDITAFANDLISRAGNLDVFGCLDRSFKLWKSHFLALVGVTILTLVCQMMINMVPIVGSLAGLLLNGVFYGGLYHYYLGKIREEPRNVGDVFAGFQRGFTSLMGATVITTFASLAIAMATFGPPLWPIFAAAMQGEIPATIEFPAISPLLGAVMLIGFLLMVYLSVAWLFTFALIVDKGLSAWTAMEISRRVISHQWFRVFFVALLGGILAMLGLIGFGVGVFLTLPLAFGAIMYAYEDLCNPPSGPSTTGLN